MKVFAYFLLALLILNLISTFTVPFIQVEAKITEKLAQRSDNIEHSKRYVKNNGLSVIDTIGLKSWLDLTVTFSRNKEQIFRLPFPDVLPGGTTVLQSNSSVIDLRRYQGNFFISEMWFVNEKHYRMDLCWSLPKAQEITFSLQGMRKINASVVRLGNLYFDWADALKAGFNPRIDEKKQTITITVQKEGCLDPVITSELNLNPDSAIYHKHAITSVGNSWYVATANTTNYLLLCSVGGTTFRSYTSPYPYQALSLGLSSNPEDEYGAGITPPFYNGTHILVAVGDVSTGTTKRFFAVSLSANCGMTISQNTTIGSTNLRQVHGVVQLGISLWAVIANYGGVQTLYKSDLTGGSWTNVTKLDPVNNGQAQYSFAQIFNFTSNRITTIISTGAGGDNLYGITYYPTNSSLGSLVLFNATVPGYGCCASTSIIEHTGVDCVQGTKIFCAWQSLTSGAYPGTSGKLLHTAFDGSFWYTPQIVANIINPQHSNEEGAFGISKKNGIDQIIFYRIPEVFNGGAPFFHLDKKLKYNITDSTGFNFVEHSEIALWSVQVSEAWSTCFLSVSARPNASGYIGLMYTNTTGLSCPSTFYNAHTWFALDSVFFVPTPSGPASEINPHPDFRSRFTDVTMSACRRFPSGVISANYTDTRLNTTSLQILIYNSTGTKFNQTFLNNNSISITYSSGDTNNTHLFVAKFIGSHINYGAFTEIRTIPFCLGQGRLISLDPFTLPGFVADSTYTYFALGILMILSLAFGAYTASTGAILVSLLAGFFMIIGWLPISGGLVAVAVLIAAFNKLIQERRGID